MSDEELELDPPRIVYLLDEDSKDRLETEVFIEIEMDGKTYALLTPTAPVVTVMRSIGDPEEGELEELELEEFGALKKHFVKALEPYNVTIIEEGGELLLQGDPDEDFFTDCEVLDVETDNGDDELLVLVRVETGDITYLIATPSVPAMYPAELIGDEGRPLTPEELETMHDVFTEALHGVGMFDDEDDEDDDEDDGDEAESDDKAKDKAKE